MGQQDIIDCIRALGGEATKEEIISHKGVQRRSVNTILKKLIRDKCVEVTTYGRYKLIITEHLE